jgi:hypothetical protein
VPSRADRPPTPAELAARTVVADVDRVAGVFRWEGGFHVGHSGTVRPYVAGGPRGDARFVAAAGGRMRIEDDLGLLRVSDGVRTVVREYESGALVEPERVVVGIGPERLVHPQWQQIETATATRWQGRPAWLVTAGSVTAVLDDATSIEGWTEWRQDDGALGGRAELLDLDWDPVLPDDAFAIPDVPTWTAPPRRDRPEHDRSAWGDRPRPTVTWTPTGLPHTPLDGDVATGWLVQQVRVLTAAGAIHLRLHRRPAGVDAPLPDAYRWTAAGCDWALEVAETDGPPLTVAEVAEMAGSIETATPWPAPTTEPA